MRTLNLTLTRKWFDLTLSGEKHFEYREAKPYWKSRLFHKDGTPKEFDLIRYTNGYGAHRPFILVKFGGVIEGIIGGRHIPKNGEPLEDGQEYYLIVNGSIVEPEIKTDEDELAEYHQNRARIQRGIMTQKLYKKLYKKPVSGKKEID